MNREEFVARTSDVQLQGVENCVTCFPRYQQVCSLKQVHYSARSFASSLDELQCHSIRCAGDSAAPFTHLWRATYNYYEWGGRERGVRSLWQTNADNWGKTGHITFCKYCRKERKKKGLTSQKGRIDKTWKGCLTQLKPASASITATLDWQPRQHKTVSFWGQPDRFWCLLRVASLDLSKLDFLLFFFFHIADCQPGFDWQVGLWKGEDETGVV